MKEKQLKKGGLAIWWATYIFSTFCSFIVFGSSNEYRHVAKPYRCAKYNRHHFKLSHLQRILLFLLLSSICFSYCSHPKRREVFTESKIFPLSPYVGGIPPLCERSFILEKNIGDTTLLIQKLRSLVENTIDTKNDIMNCHQTQFDFYRISEGFDISFRESKQESLFPHNDDHIASIMYVDSKIHDITFYQDSQTIFIGFDKKGIRTYMGINKK